MDGLSAAASVIGVISLAIQLGQSTRKLIDFLDAVTDAPNEVVRLNDLLKMVLAMSAGVVNALEAQRQHYGDSFPSQEHIVDVLAVCLRRLSTIQAIVDKTETLRRSTGVASRNWTKFRFALKKDDILELERQLGQAMSVLNLLLTTSIMYHNVTKSLTEVGPASSSSPASSILDSTGVYNETFVETYDPETRPHHGLPLTKVATLTSSGNLISNRAFSLSYSTSRKKRAFVDADGSTSESESISTTVQLIPFFLSSFLELSISQTSNCSPEIGLQFQHVISSDVWMEHVARTFLTDDIVTFRDLLVRGLCNINSQLSVGPIVNQAEFCGAVKIATFLHLHGCKFDNRGARYMLGPYYVSRKPATPRFRLISAKLDLVECDPEDIIPHRTSYGLGVCNDLFLDAVEWLLVTGFQHSMLPKPAYMGSLFCIVCDRMEGNFPAATTMVAKLINAGADLHHQDQRGMTALRGLIWRDTYSIHVSSWFDLLERCQVDVRKYLSEECEINPNPFHLGPPIANRFYHCFRWRTISTSLLQKDLYFLTADDFMDTHMSGISVLQAFNFNPELIIECGHYCGLLSYWTEVWRRDPATYLPGGKSIGQLLEAWLSDAERQSDHDMDPEPEHIEILYIRNRIEYYLSENQIVHAAKLLKTVRLCHCDIDGHYIKLWPFNGNTHTMCQSGNKLGKPCISPDDWCEVHSCRFNHARFARKQEKKRLKEMRRLGVRPAKQSIPGSWVE